MLKETAFFFLYLFIAFAFYEIINIGNAFTLIGKNNRQQNHPPVVKIMAPKNNSQYEWNATVRYQISVSDQEDGESKYQEINPKEVFLEVKYIADAGKAMALLKQKAEKDPPALATMKTSNCFNCHAFKAKIIGPSFFDITKHYPHNKAMADSLAMHIRQGSSGRWGTAKMPSNEKLSAVQAQNIVQWIFKNAADTTRDFYAGTEGSFRMIPPASKEKGAFVLTASYTDHGAKDAPGQNLKGQERIVVFGK